MARLLMQGSQGGEIQLKPGTTRLGRGEENDFQIADETVSTRHCEIELRDGVAVVRDLGSTNGTYVNSALIREAQLQHGQVLQLGTFQMVYQEDQPDGSAPPLPPVPKAVRLKARVASPRPPVQPEPAAAPPVLPQAGQTDCSQHPGVPAQWFCVQCGAQFCQSCVKTVRAGLRDFRSCPSCGASCVSEHDYRRMIAKARETFFTLFAGAFAYPVKQDGLFTLIMLTIVFGLLEGARWVLHFFKFSFFFIWFFVAYWLCTIIGIGYLFAFMRNIAVSSSHGDEKMPGLPELSGFWDGIFLPFLRFTLIWVLCLAPGFAAQVFLSPFAGVPLLLLGLLCVPMALLTVSLADSVAGLNPLIIFSGIGKVPGPYLVTCLVFLAAIAVRAGSEYLLKLSPVPVLATVIGTFIGLYGLTVGMRLLGLLYYTNKEKLAWFN